METEKASLESQLGSAVCPAGDTEEMFWLRESDDYQSRVALGNALARQYRFKEAAGAYREALEIRDDEPMTWLRLGGACLTLFRFEEAMDAFLGFLDRGGSEKAIAYHMGFWHYLRRSYTEAADWFRKCLPCGGELRIAVIYWHTICCLRGGMKPELLELYEPDMEVGHHTAYRLAVSVFCGESAPDKVLQDMESEPDDLNCGIVLYGLLRQLYAEGKPEAAERLLEALLVRDRAWPNLSYLAAWRDRHEKEADK